MKHLRWLYLVMPVVLVGVAGCIQHQGVFEPASIMWVDGA